jgi:hypothetical protein
MEQRTLTFQVKFEDGTIVDKTYSEIRKTEALGRYIKEHKELLLLTKETVVGSFYQVRCVPESSSGSISSAYQASGNITLHLVSIRTSLLFRYFSSMARPLICLFNNLWCPIWPE